MLLVEGGMAKQKKEKGKKDHLIEGCIMLGIGAVFMLILCGAFGKAGAAITNFFVGSFGYAIYAYFLALIVFGILSICKIKRPKIGVWRLLSLLMFFAMVIALMHCVSSLPLMGNGYGKYLSDCYDKHNTAGGVLAGVFLYPLLYVNYLGVVICGVFALAFAAIFMFFDTFFANLFAGKNTSSQSAEMTNFNGMTSNNGFEVVKSDLLVADTEVFEAADDNTDGDEHYEPLGTQKVGQVDFGVFGTNSGINQSKVTSVEQRETAGKKADPPLSKHDEAFNLLYGNDNKEDKKEQPKPAELGDRSEYLSWTNDYRRKQILENSNPTKKDKQDEQITDFSAQNASDKFEDKKPSNNDGFSFRPFGGKQDNVLDASKSTNSSSIFDKDNLQDKKSETQATSKYDEFIKKNNESKPMASEKFASASEKSEDIFAKSNDLQVSEEIFPKKQEKPFVKDNFADVKEKAFSDKFAEAQDKLHSEDSDKKEQQTENKFSFINDLKAEDKTASHSEIEGFEQLLKHQKEEKERREAEEVQKRHDFSKAFVAKIDEDEISEETARRERIRKERSDKGGVHNSSKQTSQAEEIEQPTQPQAEMPADKNVVVEKLQPVEPQRQEQPTQVVAEKVTAEVKREKTRVKLAPYKYPPIELLADYECKPQAGEDFSEKIQILEATLSEFGIDAKVNRVVTGPTFTRLELVMPKGVSVKRVLNYVDDVAMCLEVKSVRFQVPIPGKNAFGVEIPNKNRGKVGLKSVIQSEEFVNSRKKIAFAVGQNCDGENFVADLAAMPHLLIAGATGAGKSVCLNSLIVSLLYKYTPDELKLLLVDPKQVELNMYNRIPHMLIPEAISDKTMALNMLDWAIEEMEARYTMFKDKRVQKITDYNEIIDPKKEEKLPYIVIIIDEVGDFMLVIKKELEEKIQRLTQKARAAGIHLILATQRPSVDVITGVIKANLPARIAFAVTNFADSKTILDQGGADKLLRYGDMIFADGVQDPSRLQGTLVEGVEVNAVCDYIRANNESYFDKDIEEYICNITTGSNVGANPAQTTFGDSTGEQDELFVRALYHVVLTGAVSISKLQRKFGIGFPRAARLVDTMEDLGYIRSLEGNAKAKEIVIDMPTFLSKYGDVKLD